MEAPARPRSKSDIRSAMARLLASARERAPDVALPASEHGTDDPVSVAAGPMPPRLPAPSVPNKVPISIRLDADLVATLRASGRGWQSRVNAILRDAIESGSASAEHLSGDPKQKHRSNDGDNESTEEAVRGAEPEQAEEPGAKIGADNADHEVHQ